MPGLSLAQKIIEKIKDRSKEMQPDLDYYYRVGKGHEDHTYLYIIGCMARRLDMKRQDDVRAGEVNALTSTLKQGRLGMAGAGQH